MLVQHELRICLNYILDIKGLQQFKLNKSLFKTYIIIIIIIILLVS